ncbi:MAG TPA: hypothetical protein VNS46_21915 [Nocardioides sp.]|nr:hypothetical protein [Nocardioides sp.]
MSILTLRKAAALASALLALSLSACSDNHVNDVTNDPVDDSSTTPPEEGDNAGEEDTGGVNDDN